jgi:hypothetical protein
MIQLSPFEFNFKEEFMAGDIDHSGGGKLENPEISVL